MDEPFVNQNGNDNSAYQTNPEIPRNIDHQENQFQNQGQYQSNQQNMEQPPGPTFYLPSQNTNTPYEKPLNSQQNQVIIPIQPYPNISLNYPQKNADIQAQPIYNNQNQNLNDFSEIPHRGISHPDNNTFIIKAVCCYRFFPIIFFLIGLFFVLLYIFTKKYNYVISAFFGLCMIICSLPLYCLMFSKATFILGPNTLTIKKKALCYQKTLIYNPGEIIKVDFNYKFSHGIGQDENDTHHYKFTAITNRGLVKILNFGNTYSAFTQEEIDFFLYIVNTHIQNNMRV